MRLHEKIRLLREKKDLSREELYDRLKGIFGEQAISLRTLHRIERGDNDGKSSTLHQIAMGLGVPLNDLKANTEAERPPVECVRKYKRTHGHFNYGPLARMEFLFGPQAHFLMSELILEPGTATPLEQDPQAEIEHQKGLFVTQGAMTVTVDSRPYRMRKGDSLLFFSHLPHCFANESVRAAHAILVQYPQYI